MAERLTEEHLDNIARLFPIETSPCVLKSWMGELLADRAALVKRVEEL